MIRDLEIHLYKVAIAMGWSIVETRRRFLRAGKARKILGSREYFVSRAWLESSMRSVVERIDELEDAGLLRSTRGCKRRDAQGRYTSDVAPATCDH